jgi:hypothetical protein
MAALVGRTTNTLLQGKGLYEIKEELTRTVGFSVIKMYIEITRNNEFTTAHNNTVQEQIHFRDECAERHAPMMIRGWSIHGDEAEGRFGLKHQVQVFKALHLHLRLAHNWNFLAEKHRYTTSSTLPCSVFDPISSWNDLG